MNVHISYKIHRTPDIDKEVLHGIEKLQKRLQVFRPELVHFKGLIEQSSAREGIAVSFNLRLPSGQMAVQQSANAAASAIKAAFEDLLSQVSRHKELLRNSHRWRRRGAPAAKPAPEVPFEQTIASVPSLTATSDDVRSFINANLRRLELFVEREIYFRENSGSIEPQSFSVEEVLDEAVARALDEKIEKPDRLGIEAWLYRLSLQAMDDLATASPEAASQVNLQDLRQSRRERASDEARLQFHQPDEAMTTESGIADTRLPTPEDIAYTDEMISLVQFALQGARPEDREAFILHGIEGFSITEIAAITDRKAEEVESCILRAREKLRASFPVNSSTKRRTLHATATR